MLVCALTDEATWGSVLQVIVLRKQGDNFGEDGFAHQLPLLVFGNNSRSHLNLLTNLMSHSRETAVHM